MKEKILNQGVRLAVHLAAPLPLAVLLWNLAHDQLSADPIRGILLWTGKTALTLLLLSLACTPANILFGFRWALRVRRALGLYAFGYIVVHLFTFLVIDYGLDLGLLREALLDKPYAFVGLAAFLLLVPSAITSTRGWMRRLGQTWKHVHRGVYAAALLAIVHFVWLVKADVREPLTYGAIAVALLGLRLPPVRHGISRVRQWPRRVRLAPS